MKIQWYMWVGLALILAPIVQQWIATYYPAEAFPMAALVVVLIGGVAKWLELVLRDSREHGGAEPPPGVAAAPVAPGESPSKMARIFWDA